MKRLIFVAMLAASAPFAAPAYQFIIAGADKVADDGWSDRKEGNKLDQTLDTRVSAAVRTSNGISRYAPSMFLMFN